MTYVWSVALYGREIRAINKKTKREGYIRNQRNVAIVLMEGKRTQIAYSKEMADERGTPTNRIVQ